MSGGSYDYLCYADAANLFGRVYDLTRMAERLAGLPYAVDAATDTYDLLAILRTQEIRIEAAIRRLSPVWRAVEWWDSCDYGEDQVQKAIAKYRGPRCRRPCRRVTPYVLTGATEAERRAERRRL